MHILLLCSTCMFKALLLLQGSMMVYFLHLLLMNLMLYVTHTLLIMYLMLFGFSANTITWHQNFAYSASHLISKFSPAMCLIRYFAKRPPQRLGFVLGMPCGIPYRQSGTGTALHSSRSFFSCQYPSTKTLYSFFIVYSNCCKPWCFTAYSMKYS